MLRSLLGSEALTSNNAILGRTKNKFEQGFLGGIGSDSQFQTVFNLPIQPFNSNNDLLSRFASTTAPSWDRSYAFAPGRGLDARATNITFTTDETMQTASGIVHPVIYPGLDQTTAGPAPPLNANIQGINAIQTVPMNLMGGEREDNVGKLISSGVGGGTGGGRGGGAGSTRGGGRGQRRR